MKHLTAKRTITRGLSIFCATLLPVALSACGSASLPTLGSLTGSTEKVATLDPETAAAQSAIKGVKLPPASGQTVSAQTPTSLVKQAALKPAGPQPVAQQKPSDPLAIPLQVASTSARAKKCGFYFQPAQIKAGYLAYEAAQGASAKRVSVLDKIYTVAEGRVYKAIAQSDTYCNEQRVAQTRAALNSYLAGNYSYLPPKKQKTKKIIYTDNFREKDQKPMTEQDAFGPNWKGG